MSSGVTRTILLVAGLMIIVAGLKASVSLVVPLLLSAVVAVICAPPMFWLQRKGVPGGLAVFIIVLVVIALNVGVTALVGNSVQDFTNNLPQYQDRLQEQFSGLFVLLASYGLELPQGTILEQINPGSAMKLAGNLLNSLGNVLTNAFFILLTVIFILLEAASFPQKLKKAFGEKEETSDFFKKFTASLNQYLKIKTLISIGTGAVAGLLCWGAGVDYPLLWALLAFIFNYVPNIGSLIAAVPPVLLGFVQFGFGRALIVAAGYFVINTVFGSVIEPRFMGRGLGLSTLVVFLSLVVWGWVLGPVGMLLSVPLTMMAKIALEANDETRWVAVMLGAE